MRSFKIALGGLVACLLLAVTPALASAQPALHAWWRLSSRAAPTNLPPGGVGLIEVAADDLGDTGVSGAGSPVTITDVLPTGLRVTDPTAVDPHRSRAGHENAEEKAKFWKCTVTESRIVSCTTPLAIPPYERLEMEIPVEIDEPAGTETTLANEVIVRGGESVGASAEAVAEAKLKRSVTVSSLPVAFGVEPDGYAIVNENGDGSLDTTAGSHPFQLTSVVNFNQTIEEVQEPGFEHVVLAPAAPALARNLTFDLPPGLLGNVTAATQCSEVDFSALVGETNRCPASATIGVATVTLNEPNRTGYITLSVPVFNLEPAPGEPARFGFEADWVPVVLDATVRTEGDYGVRVSVNDATEAAQVLGAQVTFWGNPGGEAHDQSRGWACIREGLEKNEGENCEAPSPRNETPFLSLPTSCTGEQSTLMSGEAWNGQQLSNSFVFQNALGEPLQGFEGCATLPFEPAISLSPQGGEEGSSGAEAPVTTGSTPTGLKVGIMLPQTGTLEVGGAAESTVKAATVTLPPGMTVNPSAANGLEACSEQQIGYEGPAGEDPFVPGAAQPLKFSASPPGCPKASKIGSVEVDTPLLTEKLEGGVYLAEPAPNGEAGKNPFGSLVALYVVATAPKLGIHATLAGEGHLDPQTGQITTTFLDTPQVPFEDITLRLFGGPRAPVGTPAACGSYAASASFTPWSGGEVAGISSTPFAVSSGPGGAPCPGVGLPFVPSFNAGSTGLLAGGFTSFRLTVGNPD
ncbi:MAG TPA: hypothetical protein VGG08_09385, partial [Solirubrobacteraceae bacterium]